MNHTFDVTVSKHHADVALRRFIFRGLGWSTFVAAALCIAYIIYDGATGGMGYLSIVIITVLLLLALVYAVLVVSRRKQMAQLLKRLGDEPVSYELSDSELSTETALGSSTLKWEMIKKLWIDPDLTLVFYARNGYTTIPTDQIPSEALIFIADRVKSVGGTVTDNTTRAEQG